MSGRLLKSTATVGGMTLVSRVLGFARDVVIARAFGAGPAADAFFVAFRIPNFLRRLFAEGAFAQAFVPVLSEYKEQRTRQDVQRLVDHVGGALGSILALVTLAGVAAAPWLVMGFAPGFVDEPDRYGLTVAMLRITFPYLAFISLTALAGAILNSYGRFAVPAFTPVFLNIVLILCAAVIAPYLDEPVTALAWGVLAAGLVQLGFQVPFLLRLGLLPRPWPRWRDPGVQRILKLMLPTLFGSSVAQINLLFDTLIASFLVAGSVSWLYYSDRLVEFPLGVFGIALATVILPKLSREVARAAPETFSRTLDWGLRLVLLIAVPASIGLALLAGPVLATLFQYGEFSGHDTAMAARSLIAYALGLPAFILVKVLTPGFYARKDAKTPVKIGIVAMFANMVLNVILVFPLAHAGLALATAASAYLNGGLLLGRLRRDGVYRAGEEWGGFALRIGIAGAGMTAVLWLGMGDLGAWLDWGLGQRVLRLAGLILSAAAVYFGLLWLMGVRPRHLWPRELSRSQRFSA
jgi:putative peptidoglycan lipid II flippase